MLPPAAVNRPQVRVQSSAGDPSIGINNQQSLEHNSRLGSALLSWFDLIFPMLDQAEFWRVENIAYFLLQQFIAPRSGCDGPLEIEDLDDDKNVNRHWSMEKLRAYVAARSREVPSNPDPRGVRAAVNPLLLMPPAEKERPTACHYEVFGIAHAPSPGTCATDVPR